jgi:hypothetical protein
MAWLRGAGASPYPIGLLLPKAAAGLGLGPAAVLSARAAAFGGAARRCYIGSDQDRKSGRNLLRPNRGSGPPRGHKSGLKKVRNLLFAFQPKKCIRRVGIRVSPPFNSELWSTFDKKASP